MLFKGTSSDDVLQGTNGNDTLQGNDGDDFILGNDGDDLVSGGDGNDVLFSLGQGRSTFDTGGSDTLTGGKGQDTYSISLESGGGSVVKDESPKDNDVVLIFAENMTSDSPDTTGLEFGDFGATTEALEFFGDPNTWGDSFIELSSPEKGIVGLEKSGTSLIIDISRDGVADASDDLTITNYFDEQGDLGTGAPVLINNIIDQQDIVNFFA